VVRRAARVTLGVAALGLLFGAGMGRWRFESSYAHDDATCASCHHAAPAEMLDARDSPHGRPADAKCHTCHVLPVREYLVSSLLAWGATPPDWVEEIDDPTIDGQSCMECHLARGRGSLACERCHVDGSRDVDLASRCDVCHTAHPALDPHDDQDCRDCHVEAMLPPDHTHSR
jgi:hypothetical protein